MKKNLLLRSWARHLYQKQGHQWKGVLIFPLIVSSWVYGVGVWIWTTLYRRGVFKIRQLPCRVLSVGNITVGGTGKTPLVATLARELSSRGMRVAILSRGYKGSKEKQGGLLSDGERIYLTPAEAGDEPFMLATRLPGVPVLVGKKRYEMGMHAVQRFGIDCLILDDGFQHIRIKRDADIVLVDARRGFGNGRLFPGGPLREPLRCLQRASLLVITKAEVSQPLGEIEAVLRRYAPATPLFHSRYKSVSLVEVASKRELPPQFVQGKRVFVFAGIVDPEYFVYVLEGLGAQVVRTEHFPDHYDYTLEDVRMIGTYRDMVDMFVTTEKDCVKLREITLDDLPIFMLTIEQEIREETFYQSVLSALSS
jgi:tetraacyldisaccharide 4'-kinase